MTDMIEFQMDDDSKSHNSRLLEQAVLGKPCAWISSSQNNVALLEGFSVANMSPQPILMMAAHQVHFKMTKNLKVTLSIATVREKEQVLNSETKQGGTFSELRLQQEDHDRPEHKGYPPAVASSPIYILCHVHDVVNLLPQQEESDDADTNVNDSNASSTMLLLAIDVIYMKKEILTVPPSSGERTIVARVDAMKLQPIASFSFQQHATFSQLHSLLRPSKKEDNNNHGNITYQSDPFVSAKASSQTEQQKQQQEALPPVIVWNTCDPSPLGFNPIKAIVLPRPIGWIGTYYSVGDETEQTKRMIPHVAPYSFYMQVGRDLVAFAAYRPTGGEPLKDVQLDVEQQHCFTVSTVTPPLVEAMNLSSAPIERDESEFDLSAILEPIKATHVNAPYVKKSPLVLECTHVQTMDVGAFSVIVGKIVAMQIDSNILLDKNDSNRDTNNNQQEPPPPQVDTTKLSPVTRLGYTDEYAIIDKYL